MDACTWACPRLGFTLGIHLPGARLSARCHIKGLAAPVRGGAGCGPSWHAAPATHPPIARLPLSLVPEPAGEGLASVGLCWTLCFEPGHSCPRGGPHQWQVPWMVASIVVRLRHSSPSGAGIRRCSRLGGLCREEPGRKWWQPKVKSGRVTAMAVCLPASTSKAGGVAWGHCCGSAPG